MSFLKISNLHKSYGSLEILKDINLEIEEGGFLVLVGPSGCGKSTLLNTIAGLEPITSGDIAIDGRSVAGLHPSKRDIAMVFQSYALYPHMSVYDNVGFGLKMAGTAKDVRDAKIREAARILQMEHLLDRKPSQLSGGQRQRVAIGRAIVRQPEVFLFDEPLSNLDAALRVDMRMELAKLHHDLGSTMIYVTHDQVEAMTLADKIVVLDGGVVQQVGAPIDLYQRPANLFVAGFIGSPKMNLVKAKVEAVSSNSVRVSSVDITPTDVFADTTGLKVGDEVTIGVRPQVLTAGESGSLVGRIDLVERLGSETNVSVSLQSGQSIMAVLDGDRALRAGDSIVFGFEPSSAIIFDGTGTARHPIAAE